MLERYAERYRRELFDSVLPFWLRHSVDPGGGGFFTCLDRDGSLYDPRKYVWLNGRQVWTLCRLYNDGHRDPALLDAARGGAEFLRRHVFDPEGRCYFSLTRAGEPASFQRKPYSGVFVMLGFHEFYRATGEEGYRDAAVDLYRQVRRWIGDSSLLGRPPFPAMPPVSGLADIYVVLSMAQQLGDPAPQREMLDAIQAHWVPEKRLFLENAVLDPARRFLYPDGRLICAGSIFEISWFLLDALLAHPDPARQAMVLAALEGALDFAWDRQHGGFFYFQDIESRPLLQLEGSMKLWWVHAEALYALIRAYEATREQKWLRWLEVVDDYVFSHFPDPGHGEWFGYLDRAGRPTHTLKGNHYKGCFHIPRALWFSLRAMERINAA